MIIVFCGLPGSGKSYLANQLAKKYNFRIINRDDIRDGLFYKQELDYSDGQNAFASHIAYELLGYLLQHNPNRTVLLDGRPFSKRSQRSEIVAVARQLHQGIRFVHCYASDDIIRKRLSEDAGKQRGCCSDRRTFERYLALKQSFEPFDQPVLQIDTQSDVVSSMKAILNYIKESLI